MQIATWCIQEASKHLPAVIAWVRAGAPHVLCFPVLGPSAEPFPFEAFYEEGYFTKIHGTATSPGPVLLALEPLTQVRRDVVSDGTRWLEARVAGIHVVATEAFGAPVLHAWETAARGETVLAAGRRVASFTPPERHVGVRLGEDASADVVLVASSGLAGRCRSCEVVPVVSLPHGPLVATFSGFAAAPRPPGVLPEGTT
ncbi:MAG: exonuclease/endonuclease/phosphatase family protein [Planctomycetota bacterium]|jgi:hypothetical protein